jgi:hypothetical protein
MKVDPELIKQAKAELSALVDLGKVDFSTDTAPSSSNYVFVGVKLKPALYRWVKAQANYFSIGNVNGFVRSLLEGIKEKQENTHNANQSSRKRIPS